MSQNVVLGDPPSDPLGRTVSPVPSASVDTVRALSEVVHRSLAVSGGAVRGRQPRPFDAQYWACWLVALVLPMVVVYLVVAY